MMGFCVNLLNVDASFEMGPRWIFLTDGEGEREEITFSGKFSPGKSSEFFEILSLFPY